MTETTTPPGAISAPPPQTDTADARTRPAAAEALAAGSDEWRRLVELCRAARDVEALAREFLATHVRLCGCPLCLHFATAGGPTAKAARQLLRTVDGVVRVSVALRAGALAAGPAAGGPTGLDRPAEVTKHGIRRARVRLSAARECADPKQELRREKAAPPAVPCG